MNECTKIQGLIPWYIEGVLSKQEERDVAAHLCQCERCRDDLVLTMRVRLDVRGAWSNGLSLPDRVRDRVTQKAFGRKLAQVDIGSFFLGLSLGARLRKGAMPVHGDLSVMGRRIRLFNTGRKGGTR